MNGSHPHRLHLRRFLLALLLFASACTLTQRSVTFPARGAVLSHAIPRGWHLRKVEAPADHLHILSPRGVDAPSDPAITVDYYERYDPRFPKTEAGCAASYLAGIHDVKDPDVRMATAGRVETLHHGTVTLYRFHSDYYGDHLVAFIPATHGFVTLELWTQTTPERQHHQPAFKELVSSLHILSEPKNQELRAPSTEHF